MPYKLVLLKKSKEDVQNIYKYIAAELQNLKAAKDLNENFNRAFRQIQSFPLSAEKFNETIRKLPVNNYIVFYKIDDEQKIISICRVLYGRTDYDKIL
jgi:addiction module RelE/StbE family toxin